MSSEYEADLATQRDRASTEPPIPQPGDITSLDALRPHVDRAIKFTRDQGESWEMGVVHGVELQFQGGEKGYYVARELGRYGVHSDMGLTDVKFAGGVVARLATPEECEGVKFAYGYVPYWG